jgi:signal transduction histidine kinase
MGFAELVDIEKLLELFESYTKVTGAVTALVELDGTVIIATGWKDICTRFHRVNKASACRCTESDTMLAGNLKRGKTYSIYKCKNGLIDVAVPIKIRGEHVANFFTGQFFTEPPDVEYFIRQAEEFGFERDSYLEALGQVPILSEETIKATMNFFTCLAQQIGEIGLVRREQELMIARLNEKTEEQERFVYTVSHDLKSPLVTISGFIGMIEQDFLSGDQTGLKENLSVISSAARRMRQLLDELLEISRIGIKKNQEEVVNLGTLIRASTDNLSGVINEFKTTVEVESELPDVMVDKQRFLQVFENLIANAIRYSREAKGGSVVKVGVIRGVGELTCYVKDNGIGIEPAYLEKIFGLFERLDTNSDGTGVGLAIVKRIIETHGGRIWAESEGLGHGTTVFFTLPEAKQ